MAEQTITMIRSGRVLGRMRQPGDVVAGVPEEVVRSLEMLNKCARGKPADKPASKTAAADKADN